MKKIYTLITTIALILLMAVNVFAYSSVDEVAAKYGPNGTEGLSDWEPSLKGYFSTTATADKPNNIVVGSTIYYYGDSSAIISTAEALDSKAKSSNAMQELDQAIQMTTGGGADFVGAASLLSGVQPYFQKGVGLILILAVLGMSLSVGLDVLYICIPAMQEAGTNAMESGNNFLTKSDKKSGDGSRKLRWISRDAIKAVQIGDETDKYPILIYGKRRIIIMVTTVAIIWLLAGNKYMVVVGKLVDLLDGVLQLFN